MRTHLSAILCGLVLGSVALPAVAQEAAPRARHSKAEVAHAKRMVRALDDYDAQIDRRMKQLRAEQRRYKRMGY